MAEFVTVKISSKRVIDLLKTEAPKVVNRQANRGFTRATNEFAKVFTKAKLTGRSAPFRVKRRVPPRKTRPDRPKLTNKMRAAGFVAKLQGLKNLKIKKVTIRNSNPLILIREFGGTIKPQKSDFLFVQVPPREVARNSKVRGKKAIREQAQRRLELGNQNRARNRQRGRVIVAKTKGPFVFGPTLGFRTQWRAFQPMVTQILRKDIVTQSVRTINRRGRGRRAA